MKITENQKKLKIAFTPAWKGGKFKGYNEHIVWSGQSDYKTEANLRDNKPFKATIKYTGFTRGRSSLNIEWVDEDTKTIYYSGMDLLHRCLINNTVENSSLTGEFIFKKQGTSILIDKL